MDPSSLIFVVIVAIWAAYLLGHWVRRRDQVATVRSVDRFSEAMRVLERRPAVRSVPLSRPNPRSYVVAPTRAAEPHVSVKRAPAVARVVAPAVPMAAVPMADVPVPAVPVPDTSVPRRAPQAPRRGPQPARAGRARAAASRSRQVLAVTLLTLLVATPVSWLLVALTQAVAWWVGAVVTLALVACVAHLRRTARLARELARRRERVERRTQSQARRQSRRQVVGEVVAAHRERRGAEDVDAAAADEIAASPAPSAQVHEPRPGEWQPVPVPPLTYTLKPKAPPRTRPVVTAPAAGSSQAPGSSAARVAPPVATPAAPVATPAPAFDLDEILERRIASGS